MSTVADRVIKVVADHMGLTTKGDVVASHNLTDDLGADSLDNIELLFAMEEEFNIDIKDSDFENVQTVQDIIDVMRTYVKDPLAEATV